MAGPAIRALELARALAEHCDVTLAAPAPSDPGDAPVELLEAGMTDFGALLEAFRRHDVVLAQGLPPQLLRYVARMPIRYVADLYDPLLFEMLEAMGDGGTSPQRAARSLLAQCAVADLVICASEKQRDLWLGGMGLAGLIDPERYRRDPTFRSFIDVVPFGLPDRPPQRSKPVLKGVWPGIGERRSGAAVAQRRMAVARRADADPGGRAPARPGACGAPRVRWDRPPVARRRARTLRR